MRKLNHWIALAISLTALVFASCGSGFVEGATTEGDISKTVKKTVTFTAYGDEGIVTFPFKEADGARTILPTALDGRNLHFYYWGEDKLNSSNTTIGQPKAITFYAEANSYGRTGAVELDLPTSQYTLFLYALPTNYDITNNATNDTNAITGAAVLKATATVDLRYNEKINFYLTPYSVTGNGEVALKVMTNWTIGAPYTTTGNVKMSMRNLTDNSVVGTEASLTDAQITAMSNPAAPLSAANFTGSVAAGTYNFTVEFSNTDKNPVQKFYYTEPIIVLAHQTTSATVIIPQVTGTAPAQPQNFTVRYADPENTKTGYYDAEFLWTDSSINEQYFQLDLMDVTDLSEADEANLGTKTDTQWDDYKDTQTVVSYDNTVYKDERYIAGNLNANSKHLVLSLDLGKRYYARLSAVNDAGASAYKYFDFSVTTADVPTVTYTRPGASAALDAASIKLFDENLKSINRFRITYNLVKGAYYQTTYYSNPSGSAKVNDISEITWSNIASKTNISALDGTATAHVVYSSQIPVDTSGPTTTGGTPILNPLKVEGTTSGSYYSLAKNKNSWTGWKLNSIEGTTVYTLDPSITDTAKPVQTLKNLQDAASEWAANYKSPYEGCKNLDLFAVYGKADVTIYNPADKEILDTDILVFKSNETTPTISNAKQVATIDEANSFRVNINSAEGYKALYVAVRNKNYAKIKMTITDQGNGVRLENEGTVTQTFNADRYILLTSEPDDWTAAYNTSYYKKTNKRSYALNDETTWAANTFYRKEAADSTNNSFTYFTIPIATSYAPGSAYTITIYAYTQYNTKYPFTVPLTMSIVDSSAAQYSPTTFMPVNYAANYGDYLTYNGTSTYSAATDATWSKGTSSGGIWQKD